MTKFTISVHPIGYPSNPIFVKSVTLGTPFYGTDANGKPVRYTWSPGSAWNTQQIPGNPAMENGNTYSLSIRQYWSADDYVDLYSYAVFKTRANPTLSISPASGTTITSVEQAFTGSFSQTQGDTVAWARWTLSDGTNVIDDTGVVYTPVLAYTYDGFFSGKTYTLTLTVETSSGVTVAATGTYAVSYSAPSQSGGFSVTCNADDSSTLSWAGGTDIPGTAGGSGTYSLVDSVLHLGSSSSIEWSQVNGEAMSFASPYCLAWKGYVAKDKTDDDITVTSGSWALWKTYPTAKTASKTVSIASNEWRRTDEPTDIVAQFTVDTVLGNSHKHQESLSDYVADGYCTTYDPDLQKYYFVKQYYADGNVELSFKSLSGADDYNIVYNSTYNLYLIYVYGSQTDHGVLTLYRKKIWYEDSATISPASGITDAWATNTEGNCTASITVDSSTELTWTVTADYAGTYSATFKYRYDNPSTRIYYATKAATVASSDLSPSGDTIVSFELTDSTVTGTSAPGGATSTISAANEVTVTAYSGSTSPATVYLTIDATAETIGSESYRSVVTGTKANSSSASIYSTTATSATVSYANGAYTVTMYAGTNNVSKTAVVRFVSPERMASATLMEIPTSSPSVTRKLKLVKGTTVSSIDLELTQTTSIAIPSNAYSVLYVIRRGTQTDIAVTFFGRDGNVISTETQSGIAGNIPSPITSITLNGAQWCDYVFVSSNKNYDFAIHGYTPGWDSQTLFYAPFDTNLQAGTVASASSVSVAIYRKEGTVLSKIGVFDGSVTKVTDYAVRSSRPFSYEMFYIASGVYSTGDESATFCRQFKQHTLIEAEEDSTLPNTYHPVRVWRFANNTESGAYSNGNKPNLLENFTKYPLWQPSSQSAKSGTLTGLLGRFEDGEYQYDTAGLMDELFELSTSNNPLFYRDRKGNLYMVRVSSPIVQTITDKSLGMPVKVSLPWTEVGDASNVRLYTTTETGG